MGVPGFGALSEALALEEVHGERFEQMAVWLDALRDAALARSADRDRLWADAGQRVAASGPAWAGPNGDDARRRFAEADRALARPGPSGPTLVADGRAGFEALADLARTAREIGRAIDAVQGDHRNRVQALLGGLNDQAQRAWTTLQWAVGAESSDDAHRTHEAIDKANREREAAEREVEHQLGLWREACRSAAGVIDRAIAAYAGALSYQAAASATDAGATVPGASDPHRRWLEDVVIPFLGAHAGDREVLASFWRTLTDEQRRVLMGRAPELIEAHLLDVLTAEERSRFLGRRDGERLRDALRTGGLDPDRFDPQALRRLDPTSPEYEHLLDRIERDLLAIGADPVRAAAYYESLGVEGLRTLIGWLELGLEAGDEARRGRLEGLVSAVAASFAPTTGTPELAGLRDTLLAPEAPWQLHQLAVLLSADGKDYDPAFLARAFDVIDRDSERLSAFFNDRGSVPGSAESQAEAANAAYPQGTVERPLYHDLDLLVPAVVVRRALAGNPEGAWLAVHENGAVSSERLERLMQDHSRYAFVSAGVPPDRLTAEGRQRLDLLTVAGDRYGAQVLDAALKVHALDDRDAAATLYKEGVLVVAEGKTTVPARRAMAGNLVTFIDDLALGQWEQIAAGKPGTAVGDDQAKEPGRPAMIAFFTELAADPRSMKLTGASFRVWFSEVASRYDPVRGPYTPDWRQNAQMVSTMVSLLRKGLIDAGAQQAEAAEALGDGSESASSLLLTSGSEALTEVIGKVAGTIPGLGAALEWLANETASAIGEQVKEREGDAELAAQQRSSDFYVRSVWDFREAIVTQHGLPPGSADPLLVFEAAPFGSLQDPDRDSKLEWLDEPEDEP